MSDPCIIAGTGTILSFILLLLMVEGCAENGNGIEMFGDNWMCAGNIFGEIVCD